MLFRSREICITLFKQWIVYYGCPFALISDNEGEFVNSIMKYMLEMFKIRMINASIYHPDSNITLGKRNKNVLGILRRLFKDEPSNWAKHLDAVCLAINNCVSLETLKSPFELIHGIKMTAPNEYRTPKMDNKAPLEEKTAIQGWKNNLDWIRRHSKNMMERSQRTPKVGLDERCHLQKLKVGDLVGIKKENLLSPGDKTSQRYSGTYKILSFFQPLMSNC